MDSYRILHSKNKRVGNYAIVITFLLIGIFLLYDAIIEQDIITILFLIGWLFLMFKLHMMGFYEITVFPERIELKNYFGNTKSISINSITKISIRNAELLIETDNELLKTARDYNGFSYFIEDMKKRDDRIIFENC